MREKERDIENGPAEAPCGCAPPSPDNPERPDWAYGRIAAAIHPPALSPPCLCDDWATDADALAGAQVFFESFAGDEHPLVFSPSLPFLLCETEHPNPILNAY